jgi:glycosyltransferase involved in cell wall biosynthesis
VSDVIWYISKYFGLPEHRVGSRPFLLLRETVKMGLRPIVFTASANHLFTSRDLIENVEVESKDGVTICWMKLRKYAGARSMGRILSWLEFEWKLWRLPKNVFPPPSVVVVSSLSLFTILNGLWLRKRYRCRLVFEVRDIWPLTLVEEGGFSPRNPFIIMLQWLEKLGYRKSDVIIGTMPNLASHVREVAGETGQVHCIPMGVDAAQLAEPAPLPKDYAMAHIPRDKFIVCHAGTIGRTNALEVLFEAARAMQSHTDIHFLLVGDGDLKERFEKEAADLPNVSFAPAVPKRHVHSLLRCCDVTFFSTYPSRVWDYGMSLNKLNDYMLAGRPVIGSYSGFPSMLNESGGGTFVPAEDASALRDEILRLASLDIAKREEIGDAARKWIISNRQYCYLAQDFVEAVLPARVGTCHAEPSA